MRLFLFLAGVTGFGIVVVTAVLYLFRDPAPDREPERFVNLYLTVDVAGLEETARREVSHDLLAVLHDHGWDLELGDGWIDPREVGGARGRRAVFSEYHPLLEDLRGAVEEGVSEIRVVVTGSYLPGSLDREARELILGYDRRGGLAAAVEGAVRDHCRSAGLECE